MRQPKVFPDMSVHFKSLLPNATNFATSDFKSLDLQFFNKGERSMALVRFYVFVLRIAIILAMMGQLKACTLELMGLAAAKHEMMSYSKYTKALFTK